MLPLLLSILLISVTSIWLWKKLVAKPDKFPPGPPRLPLIGSLPFFPAQVKNGKQKMSTWMQETFGPISGLYLGKRPMVILSDFDLIKDLYKKHEASGRPKNKPFHENRFGSPDGSQRGLLQSSGQEWQEQRRFTMKQLKDLGFGKSSMEDMINEEVAKLAQLLEKDVGKEMSMNLKLNLSIVNALWYLLTGEHFALEDPELQAIVAKFDSLLRLEIKNTPFSILMEGWMPKLAKFTSPGFKHMKDLFTDIKDLVGKALVDHKKTYDPDHPRDFMDMYLAEIDKSSNAPDSSFHGTRGEESLVSTMLDLFLAGTETTSSSLLWSILFLLHHPEVQARVQREIDEVVGVGNQVSLEDRALLPYTNAVLMESMRMATIVPSALPHAATEDIQLNGYVIPKDSVILANLLHVHYDPTYWPNPDEFNPNRFYDEATRTFKQNERLIPFSIGKRYCLGQSLAEKEYFLFFTGLLQRFTFEPAPGSPLPKIGRDSGVVVGILRNAPLYKTILKVRQ
uniref:Cytochrome P450 3075B2 n=1 Tax=Paracyclopina nana TaxID=565004 RepID=A0A0F7IZY4_PARNA|nr:cytochrome P450 3075B2 [Paracyclopina nana]